MHALRQRGDSTLSEKHKIPCLYRVHEGPSAEKLEKAASVSGEVGLSIGGGTKPRTADYQALAERIRERPTTRPCADRYVAIAQSGSLSA